MTAFKSFLADNAAAIIGVIFMLGGVATTITMQQVSINDLKKDVVKLQESKVSYAVLELKQQTLNATLEEITDHHNTLKKRVRNAIDSDIKPILVKVQDLECRLAVEETIQAQHEDELKGIWKFINKFLEKIR